MTKMLFKVVDKSKEIIQCLACNRYCMIPKGGAGFCGVRANPSGNKLELLVHSRPAAVWIDPVEKKPLFHFLPGSNSFSLGTFGCNFSCKYCQNWDLSQAPRQLREKDPSAWLDYFKGLIARCDEWPPEKIVDAALRAGCKSISFTYSEPTIFTEYAIDTMKLARKKDLKGIYVTNGYESKECWDTIKGYIDAVNIDLKAYNQKFYTELCGVPKYELVKESILYAKKLGFWVEVTTLIIPGWNDDPKELKAEAEWLASVDPLMPWHITAFHPEYKMMDTPETGPESLVRARALAMDAGLKNVYCGNVGVAYAENETTLCPKCGKKLITRYGMSVAENNVVDGKCCFCKEKIVGVWE